MSLVDPAKVAAWNQQRPVLTPEHQSAIQTGEMKVRDGMQRYPSGNAYGNQLSGMLNQPPGSGWGQMIGKGLQNGMGTLPPGPHLADFYGSAQRPSPPQNAAWGSPSQLPGVSNIDPYFNANFKRPAMPQANQQPQQPRQASGMVRVSPGVYQDAKTGKTVQSAQNPARMPKPGMEAVRQPMPIPMQGPAGGFGGMQNAMPGARFDGMSGYLNQGQDRLNQQPYAPQSPLVGALGGMASGMNGDMAGINPELARIKRQANMGGQRPGGIS